MFKLLTNAVDTTAATEVVAEAAGTVQGLQFHTSDIGEALLCSVAGMVGIFIVVGIIILSVSLLNKAGGGKKKD